MFKSGFVTILGKPNVGKSTLLNKIIKEKVSIVSPKPQTTRNNITGILNNKDYQVVFLDTPGTVKPKSKLDEYMQKSIKKSLEGIDIILYVLDAQKPFDDQIKLIESYANNKAKLLVVVNKIDETNFEKLYPKLAKLNEIKNVTDILPLSAKNGKNVDVLIKKIVELLPQGTKYYPDNLYTDKSQKFIISEIIREKALWHLQEEIPHGIAVEIESFEQKPKIIKIDATIVCEKPSHKNIIIGKNGTMLKTIGRSSRLDVEKMLETKVFLNIWVKVKENWRQNLSEINNFGYNKKDI